MTYTGSKAQAGRGSTLSIGATPTEIGEAKSISFNRGEWKNISVTNLDSGLDEELLATIRAAGTVGFKINRISSDAGQVLLEAAYQSGAATAFTLQLPKTAAQTTTGDKYAWNAFVKKSSMTVDVEQAVDGDIELQITGPAPLTVGT